MNHHTQLNKKKISYIIMRFFEGKKGLTLTRHWFQSKIPSHTYEEDDAVFNWSPYGQMKGS